MYGGAINVSFILENTRKVVTVDESEEVNGVERRYF